MSAVAVVLVVLAAGASVLRCTVLATTTGRHSLTPKHPGWEDRANELRTLTEKPGRHTQRIKTCGQVHPDEPNVTCTLPAHHSGDDHEQRFSAATRRTWSGTAHAA